VPSGSRGALIWLLIMTLLHLPLPCCRLLRLQHVVIVGSLAFIAVVTLLHIVGKVGVGGWVGPGREGAACVVCVLLVALVVCRCLFSVVRTHVGGATTCALQQPPAASRVCRHAPGTHCCFACATWTRALPLCHTVTCFLQLRG
jgi:hypothetical protein